MEAIKDKIVGAAKKIEGKLTGDKLRTAQGTAQQTKGKIEGRVASAASKVKAGARKIKNAVTAKTARARARTR